MNKDPLFSNAPWKDISPPISPELSVYPGDTPFSRTVDWSFEKGDNLVLSHIQSTLHLGAHLDAPLHFHPEGKGIESIPLEVCIGKCRIVEVKIPLGERIYPKDIQWDGVWPPRVLFKTSSFENREKWSTSYNSLSPELIFHLSNLGVILVGIDTPSVDPDDCKNLESHQALFKTKMVNLEGVSLTGVDPGIYLLIALPLPIRNGDASPVRAVIKPLLEG